MSIRRGIGIGSPRIDALRHRVVTLFRACQPACENAARSALRHRAPDSCNDKQADEQHEPHSRHWAERFQTETAGWSATHRSDRVSGSRRPAPIRMLGNRRHDPLPRRTNCPLARRSIQTRTGHTRTGRTLSANGCRIAQILAGGRGIAATTARARISGLSRQEPVGGEGHDATGREPVPAGASVSSESRQKEKESGGPMNAHTRRSSNPRAEARFYQLNCWKLKGCPADPLESSGWRFAPSGLEITGNRSRLAQTA
jgi:hypothetical protein